MTRWEPPRIPPQPVSRDPGRAPARLLEQARRERRIAGTLIGLAVGFAYALVSQNINRIALPGIPLYQPPLGPFGNIALGALAGGGFGLLCAWWDGAAQSIFISAAIAAIGTFIGIRFRIGTGSATTFAALILSVPIAWASVPVIALVRWLAEKQVEARREDLPWPRRLRLPVILAVIVALLAGFGLHSTDARIELQQMNAMVQAALRAGDVSGLPAPLQDRSVNFPIGMAAGYTLEWTNSNLDRFIELRPATNYDQQAAVIARFAGGPMLVCIYSSPRTDPTCGAY